MVVRAWDPAVPSRQISPGWTSTPGDAGADRGGGLRLLSFVSPDCVRQRSGVQYGVT